MAPGTPTNQFLNGRAPQSNVRNQRRSIGQFQQRSGHPPDLGSDGSDREFGRHDPRSHRSGAIPTENAIRAKDIDVLAAARPWRADRWQCLDCALRPRRQQGPTEAGPCDGDVINAARLRLEAHARQPAPAARVGRVRQLRRPGRQNRLSPGDQLHPADQPDLARQRHLQARVHQLGLAGQPDQQRPEDQPGLRPQLFRQGPADQLGLLAPGDLGLACRPPRHW